MSSAILAKSSYIYSANNVYSNLKENEEEFYYEGLVVSYIKCQIAKGNLIEDFNIGGIEVVVEQCDDEYDIYYLDYILNINVEDKMIIDFFVSKY